MSKNGIVRWLGAVLLVNVACSGPVPPTGTGGAGGAPVALPPAGEATCGTTAADAVWPPDPPDDGQPDILRSPDAAYDKPSCRHAYVVDLPNTVAPKHIVASTQAVSPANPIGCAASFAYLSLWKEQGSSFVKVSEVTRPGILYGFCIASASVDITTPGNYRVVAAAAYAGQYYPVALSRTLQ
jgi:hypothetical protein